MPRGWTKACLIFLSYNRPSCWHLNRLWLEAAMSTLPGHDHTSSSKASSDGKGDTDSAAKVGKSTKRTSPGYGAPYPRNSTPGFNGLIYSCSILPSIHQTWCIRIKSPPLIQRPFHWSHSNKVFCPSSYGGIYQAVPLQSWGPLQARQGTYFHTALKPSTQRGLCPPHSFCSFWAQPVWRRSDRTSCRVREEDQGQFTVGQAPRTVWWYWYPLRYVLATSPTY